MSNKSDENKISAQDEAFIDSLYAELKAENEQPSELLDQRIISAAKKAISTKPQQKTQSSTKVKSTINKIQIKPVWYVSLASAASVFLVVSLVINQVVIENVAQEPVSIQSEPLFEEKAVVPHEKTAAIGQREQVKRKIMKSSSQKRNTREFLLEDAKIDIFNLAPLAETELSANKGLVLTSQRYLLFKSQQKQCSLVSENDTYYLVNIFENGTEHKNNFVQYKLLKSEFYLKSRSSQKQDDHKISLNKFVLINHHIRFINEN